MSENDFTWPESGSGSRTGRPPRFERPLFTSTLPTDASSSASGWRSVDDFELLPERYSQTGLGPPSFFQNILNHAENRHERRQHSPAPIPGGPALHTPSHPSRPTTTLTPPFPGHSEMPRRSGFVDLTTSRPDAMPQTRSQRQREEPGSSNYGAPEPQAGPSAKRRRRNNGTSQDSQPVEQIDLSGEDADEDPFISALQKQRAEAVKAQVAPTDKALRMSSLTCIICLDTPTNLTVTACGHWFCHTCLMEALIAGENRDESRRSQCPVCRKTLNRNKLSDVFPALLKKGQATQPRKKKATAGA